MRTKLGSVADDSAGTGTSRRRFLQAATLGSAAVVLPQARSAVPRTAQPQQDAGPDALAQGLFAADERRALAALADCVLPGAGSWGAAEYIEGLLTALEHDPPRIHAGPVGAGHDWLPLDRTRERAWRLRIHGSGAVERPGEAVLGPVRGLRPLVLAGARDAAEALAGGASPAWAWWRLPGEFRDAFTELVLEGSLGDPFYGGNRDGAAWRAFHFEGAMLGYGPHHTGAHGHEDPEEEGPDPLGPFTRAALWLLGFFSRRIA